MVLVFGTICIDRVRRVPFIPGSGGYVEMADDAQMLGGEAANTALALKTWGADILLAGNSLGKGEDGDELERLLLAHGLPMEHIHRGETRAPVCDVYVTPDGGRTMFGKGFSDMRLAKPASTLPFNQGQWFTAEPNLGEEAREAARLAHKAGMRVYLMDFFKEDDPIEPGSFWQCSTDWVGHRGNMQKNVVWLRKWIDRQGCYGILSDGPNGFAAGSPDHPVRSYPPYPAPEIVDTTGAGDMFRAGMLLGLDQGWPIPKCLQFASAAACLKCRGLGATGHVPSRDDIHGHIEAHPSVSTAYDDA